VSDKAVYDLMDVPSPRADEQDLLSSRSESLYWNPENLPYNLEFRRHLMCAMKPPEKVLKQDPEASYP
jgi:hypothetical protein